MYPLNSNTKEEYIKKLRELIAKAEVENALNNFIGFFSNQQDEILYEEGLIILARLNKAKKEKLLGLEDHSNTFNIINKAFLKILKDFSSSNSISKKIGSVKPKKESLSIESIKEITGKTIKKNINLFKTSEISLEKIHDENSKLFNHIFQVFYEKIKNIPSVREHQPKVLFNRIISHEKLELFDKNLIDYIRSDEEFEWYERNVIVSALGISLSVKFDKERVNILFDFLTDFQPKVWENSLVALVLGLINKEERITDFPDLENKLSKLKAIPQVQVQLELLDLILRTRQYDYYGNIRKISNYELEYRLRILNFISSDEIVSDEDLEGLKKEMENLFENFIDEVDILKYNFYENPANWFLPFHNESPPVKEKIREGNKNFSYVKFSEMLENIPIISNFFKYHMILNIEELSQEDIDLIKSLKNVVPEILYKNSIFKEKYIQDALKLIQIVHDYFRFYKYFPTENFDNIFKKNLDIYNSGLLDILSSEIQNLKIEANFLKQNREFYSAIENYLRILEVETNNVDIILDLADCYFELKIHDSAIEIYDYLFQKKLETLKTAERIGICYLRIDNYEKALFYLSSLENTKNYTNQIVLYQAYCFDVLNQISEAEKYYHIALENEPYSEIILSNLYSFHLKYSDIKEIRNLILKRVSQTKNYKSKMKLLKIINRRRKRKPNKCGDVR